MLMLCKFPDLESEICDHHLIFEQLITINGIYLLDKFTFWQKCELFTVELVYSAYNISKHGEYN